MASPLKTGVEIDRNVKNCHFYINRILIASAVDVKLVVVASQAFDEIMCEPNVRVFRI